ncbi:contractile injection system protein, VgrG/Pvc8 family [Andreprevotia chitinilytica]|uniref:contractile injection system protein, VgrG/Pvc8 family n=1 Tax=Andreprevotia chitinilytica TaxID=396808 RepID=UPI000691AA3D|nr:contractile injection system protein, VgrG/Pvc8 family [Andreprevotia chitinilytica]
MSLPSSVLGRTAIQPLAPAGSPPSSQFPLLFLHVAFFLSGQRIISDETFRLESFQGQETVSDLFEYTLQLNGNSDANATPLQFGDLIGSSVTVGIQYPHDVFQYSELERESMTARFQSAIRGDANVAGLSLFNGIVTSFASDEPGVYRVTMKPALYRMMLTNSYQVYPQISVRDLIAQLMKKHGITYSVDGISGDNNMAISRVQDWLQAGESDFALLRRLLGKATIYYYVTHTATDHQVVFANRAHYTDVYPADLYPPELYPNGRALRYTFTGEDELGLAQEDVVTQYSYQQSLISSSVQTVFTRQEESWEVDPIPVYHSYAAGDVSTPGELPFNQYRIFPYGVSQQEVQQAVSLTGQSLQTSGSRLSGGSHCTLFRVGARFTLTGKDTLPLPVLPELDDQQFVLLEVKHEASADGGYKNDFQAAEAAGLLTPFSIEETQQGSVLAKVVDHGDGTVPSDWRYYTPDNFDPESCALIDTQASPGTLQAKGVYVRFSNAEEDAKPVWIKLASHMQTVPELGVTVVVARAQDEAELPEIQSIVHANGSRVVTPSGWTADTRVGSSYSTSYGDGKSIRFGASSAYDLQGAVDIVTDAYGSGQFREASFSQGASYSYSRSETMEQGLLNESHSYGSSNGFSWAKQNYNFSAVGTSFSESVHGTYDSASVQPGNHPEAAGAVLASVTTVNGKTYTENTNNDDVTNISTTTGNTDSTSTYNGDLSSTTTHNGDVSNTTTHHGSVSSTTTISADSDNTNTITGTSTSTNTTGSSVSTNLTGAALNTNLTGAQMSTTLQGATLSMELTGSSDNRSITGLSNRLSVVGASLDTTITGSATHVTLTGNNNVIELVGPGFKMTEQAERPGVDMTDVNITIIAVAQIYL